MKRAICMSFGVLFLSASVLAQGGAPAGPAGLAAGLQGSYNRAKGLVLGSLNEMPEDGFSHKPGDAPRTFAQIWAHIAQTNYNFCAQASGQPNPRMGQPSLEETVTTKAQALEAVQGAYAFCDPVFAGLTDASMAEQVMGGRGGSRARGSILYQVAEHDNEMYGISTVYLRTRGLVPPASQGRGRGGAGRQGGQAPAGGRGQ